jgi:hypothetical protein
MNDTDPSDKPDQLTITLNPGELKLKDLTSAYLDLAHRAKLDTRKTFDELTEIAQKNAASKPSSDR